MKFLCVLLNTLAITTAAMAAPGTDANEANQAAQADNWEWCANDFTCDNFSDFHDGGCYSQPDCRAKARDHDTIRTFGCGSGFWPRSCYVYTS